MSQPRLAHEFDWTGRSEDPNDVQFGDVVEWCGPDDLDAYDVVLVGEPYDGGVIGRPGAAEGPMAIRDALAGRKTHHCDVGPVAGDGNETGQVAVDDTEGSLRVGDLGDVALEGDVRDVQHVARAVAARVHSADALPVFLGGDNSLTCANVAPLLPEVAVLNFDAHLDVREVRDGPTSGTPYRQLLEAGLADYACLGARHFETSTAYHEYAAERDGTVVPAESVGDDPEAAVELALAGLDASRVFVSVDVDVLDATAAPGASAPTPGGLTTRELFRALRVAADDDRVAGFEVVECAPPLDRDGRTAAAAAGAVAHFLAGVSDRA